MTDDDVADWDVIDALDGLVRKSLVVAETQPDGGDALPDARDAAPVRARPPRRTRATPTRWRRRHAMHFAALLETSRRPPGPDEFTWRARREPELDNVRAAMFWAIDCEDPAVGDVARLLRERGGARAVEQHGSAGDAALFR